MMPIHRDKETRENLFMQHSDVNGQKCTQLLKTSEQTLTSLYNTYTPDMGSTTRRILPTANECNCSSFHLKYIDSQSSKIVQEYKNCSHPILPIHSDSTVHVVDEWYSKDSCLDKTCPVDSLDCSKQSCPSHSLGNEPQGRILHRLDGLDRLLQFHTHLGMDHMERPCHPRDVAVPLLPSVPSKWEKGNEWVTFLQSRRAHTWAVLSLRTSIAADKATRPVNRMNNLANSFIFIPSYCMLFLFSRMDCIYVKFMPPIVWA